MLQNQYYWGKFSRGQYVNVILQPDTDPADVPVVDYWYEGTSIVQSETMPYIRGTDTTFFYRKFLDSNFINGNYAAVMRFPIDSIDYVSIGYFQVQGGDEDAPVTSIIELDRGLGRAVVSVSSDGTAKMGYRPRILLP